MSRPVLSLLLIILFALASCGADPEATNHGEFSGNWESFLDSGTVYAMEAEDGFVLASTNTGLLVSADQGEFWDKSNVPGLDQALVSSIVLRSDRWFVASNNGKVWESTNFGIGWTPVGSLPQPTDVRMSASGQDLMAALKSGGVYRSTDNGRSWLKSDTGITAPEIGRIFYHNALLLAGPILSPMLFRSTDLGDTWIKTDSGYDASAVLDFAGLTKDIYAAAADKGVYHSANKGISWEKLNNGLPAKIYAETILADKYMTVLGGSFSDADEGNAHTVYRSTDHGKSWLVADDGLTGISEVTTVTTSNSYIIIGTRGQGIWRRKKG